MIRGEQGIVFCQDCGAELFVTGSNFLDGDNEWTCPGCGDRYVKPEGYTDDQVVAWLGFKPVEAA